MKNSLSFGIEYIFRWFNTKHWQRHLIFVMFLLLVNILLLFPNIGYPREVVFDETYLIPRAQAYINGIFFQESHPPLGRLVIALGQAIVNPQAPSIRFATVETIEEDWSLDDDMRGYRLFPAIFGTINPILVFGIILILTSNNWMALFAALTLSFDNALIVQSRFGLSDSTLFLSCLAALLCFVWLQKRSVKPGRKEAIVWALFGAFLSAAFMVKFTGLFIAAVAPFYIYKLWNQGYWRKITLFLIISGLSFLVVFVSIWQIHFSLLNTFRNTEPVSERYQQVLNADYRPNPVQRFIVEIQDSYIFIFDYHGRVRELDLSNPDEIGSPWYFWPFGGRAVNYHWHRYSETIKIIYLLGNPVTWFLSLMGVIGATATIITNGLFRFMQPNRLYWLGIFAMLYWFYMFTISRVPRVMYLYHYLLPLIMGVILFALLYAQIETIPKKTKEVILVIMMLGIIFAFFVYRPFTNYLPLTFEQFEQRNVWPAWNLDCPGCE